MHFQSFRFRQIIRSGRHQNIDFEIPAFLFKTFFEKQFLALGTDELNQLSKNMKYNLIATNICGNKTLIRNF